MDVVSQRFAHYSLGRSALAQQGNVSAGLGSAAAPAAFQDSLWFSADAYPAPLRSSKGAIDGRLRTAHAQLVSRSRAGAALAQGMASRELTVDLLMGTFR